MNAGAVAWSVFAHDWLQAVVSAIWTLSLFVVRYWVKAQQLTRDEARAVQSTLEDFMKGMPL